MSSFKSNMKGMIVSASLRKSLLHTSTALAIALATTTTFAIQAEAQVTTSRLVGTVMTAGNQPAANVAVRIVHVPSGTTKTVQTNDKGDFNAAGLRVGGPYSVSVESGAGNGKLGEIYLGIGDASNVTLVLETTSFEEIVVTGSALSTKIQMGTGSSIGTDAIQGIPSASREIYDLVQINPMVTIDPENSNAISIGGTNNRFNSVTVDGVKQNDDFGLNNGGFPTQRSPISLDVIERLDVNVAPFDVQYNGFLGGNINIVTKSGENDFHGSAFFTYRNDNLTGSHVGDKEVKVDFDEKIYGGFLSGPIIEDKLFFSVGFEELKSTNPVDTGATGSGFANEVPGVTVADLDNIQAISIAQYDFDPGSLDGLKDIAEDDRKIFAKLDWNINEDHRAVFTYQYNKGNILNPQNTNVTDQNIALPSNWYNKTDIMKSYSMGVFSDWSDSFSTEVRVSRKEVETRQESLNGNDFAQMRIKLATGASVYIGPDRYRHANALDNSTWQIKVAGSYYMGDHEISGGFEREMLDVFNLFVDKSLGLYTFDSLEDFENKEASFLDYKNAYTNNANDGAANFKYNVNSVYLQDRWTVNDDLTLMGGLRYDWYTTGSVPSFNQNFQDRNNFANTETLDGKSLFLPRFGFNYIAGERTIVRGGVGKFGGGAPNVWVSNTYTNDGLTIVGTKAFDLTNVDGYNIPQDVQDALVQGNGSANYMAPGFKIPSAWKFNIAVQHDLDLGEAMGDGYMVTAEVLHTKQENSATWIDAGMEEVGTAPDGRPLYSRRSGAKNDLGVTNTDGGKSTVFSLALEKEYDNGLDFSLSYAYTDANDVNPGTSSTATSNYGKIATADPQNLAEATSNYEIKHRIVARLNYRTEFITDLESRFGLLFTSQSGRPFSYVFNANDNDTFGDSQYYRNRALFYVPNNAAEVGLSDADWAKLDSFIQSSGLAEYRGEIAPRNAFNDPWVSRLDFKFSQEIPGIMDGHKGVFTFDIQNLTNLLNKKWGTYRSTSFFYAKSLATADIVDGGYVYHRDERKALGDDEDVDFITIPGETSARTLPSLWKIRIGVRYEF
ncbi:TonB-dependent receptor [Paremcibacter congregatus]|uniref:TonB-dependent receptor n=1 Tax=Paremcibacter congregatus TaxID=2043170 RepID=UPI003A932029